jgi:hypothetical protein
MMDDGRSPLSSSTIRELAACSLAVALCFTPGCSRKEGRASPQDAPRESAEIGPIASTSSVAPSATPAAAAAPDDQGPYRFKSTYHAQKGPTGAKGIRLEWTAERDGGSAKTFDLIIDGITMSPGTMAMEVFSRLTRAAKGSSLVKSGVKYTFSARDSELSIQEPQHASRGIQIDQLTVHADAPGSREIVVVGTPEHPVEYAGLRFTAEAPCGVLADGVVTTERAGLVARDGNGATWTSRVVTGVASSPIFMRAEGDSKP